MQVYRHSAGVLVSWLEQEIVEQVSNSIQICYTCFHIDNLGKGINASLPTLAMD